MIRLLLLLSLAALAACKEDAPPEPCPAPSPTATAHVAPSGSVAAAHHTTSAASAAPSAASSAEADPRRAAIDKCCAQLAALDLPKKHEGFVVSALGLCKRAHAEPDSFDLGDVRAVLDAKRIPHPPACAP